MNRYVSMYREVWFIDCTAAEFGQTNLHSLKSYLLTHIVYFVHFFTGTYCQTKQLFVMAIHTASGKTLPGNLAINLSEQNQLAFPELYSIEVCSQNCVVITGEDEVKYLLFELLIEMSKVFSR
jgi:hypothetical protein